MKTHRGLAAEAAIRQLVSQYGDAVNRRDAEAWAATWSTQATWNLQGKPTTGRDAIVERWLSLMDRVPFVRQELSFGIVDGPVSNGSTRGRWYLTEFTRRGDSAARVDGLYRDEYVCEQGVWRFATRDFEVLHAQRDLPPESIAGISTGK